MQENGFIQLVIIFLLLIVIISLLGVSLSSLIQNETLKENFGIVGGWVEWVWNNILKGPAQALWNIFITYILSLFKNFPGGV